MKLDAQLLWFRRNVFTGAARAYLAAATISIVAAVLLLELQRADMRVPFEYNGDGLLYSSVIKSVLDHGWFWRNPSLGAPEGLQLYDYPNVAHEALHLLIIKAMGVLTHDWALLLNVYFLLGFPLIALTGVAVLRRSGVSDGPAVVASVLYAFLPTRLLKGEGHLFLDVFFQVPLLVLMLIWVCSDAPPMVWRWREPKHRRRAVAALLLCGLSACTSPYYSFFAICLLVAGGVWASVERQSLRNALAGAALATTIIAGMAVIGLPSIVYHHTHGANPEVGRRVPAESELYGMKIVQLLLPADGHRIPLLRRLKQEYNASAPLVGENSTTSLGFIGNVGFLALLCGVFLRRRSEHAPDDPFRALAALNLGAVLVGTIGGFGALFAFTIYPQIRTYSRIVVFIGFFSLFAVALLLDRLRRARPRLAALLTPAVLAIGLLDQATPLAVRPYARSKAAFTSDHDLIHTIEARLPLGAMVFQLPYVVFPEGTSVEQLETNDLLRPYLHSKTLRWSLPTMHGRDGETFIEDVVRLPPDKALDRVVHAGFDGILIRRVGYADHGAAIEAAFRAALAAEPLASEDGRLAFFDLGASHRRNAPLSTGDPVTVRFSTGFYTEETYPTGSFRWCRAMGEILVDNDTGQWRRLSVHVTLDAARPPAHLMIGGDLLSTNLELSGPTPFARAFDVPPGHHVIRMTCDGRPAIAPKDPRVMIWRVESFAFEEVPLVLAGH